MMKNKIARIKQYSIQRRTIGLLIVLLCFFCAVFLLSSYIINKRSNDDVQKSTSETAVNNITSYIESAIEKYNYISRLVMANDNVVPFLRAETADMDMLYNARMGIYEVSTVFSAPGFIDSIFVIRNDGFYAFTNHTKYIVSQTEDVKGKLLDAKGSTIISINCDGMVKRADGRPSLTLSRAIYDITSQEHTGYLVVNISDSAFDEIISLQKANKICISNLDGLFLTGSEEVLSDFDSSFCKDYAVTKSVKKNGVRTSISGKAVLSSLVVLCECSDVAYALPAEITFALLLTLTAFIVSVVTFTFFISRNVARPISKLDDAMELTKSSGWLKRIDANMPSNEIGNLAESYNSMIDYLNELFNRLLEEEKNIQAAEMRVLQEQVKPHFLYNTLETISYLAVQENAEKCHDALETLGSFYRNFLSKGDREIPLRREIKIVQDYLTLQKLRYDDIFSDEYDLDESTLDCVVPKLLLQPLVENCIYHGVRPKGEPCIIRISSEMKPDGIIIKIYDSGIGMTREQIESAMSPDKTDSKSMLSGFGLHGTINRIRYYCDSDNAIKISSSLGEFTEISIYIPKMREGRE